LCVLPTLAGIQARWGANGGEVWTRPAGRDDDPPFRVELWDDHDRHIEEVIALVSDYATVRGALDEACGESPASSSRFGRRLG
jgi:hypothetical protein